MALVHAAHPAAPLSRITTSARVLSLFPAEDVLTSTYEHRVARAVADGRSWEIVTDQLSAWCRTVTRHDEVFRYFT